jgi:hypothetical protein
MALNLAQAKAAQARANAATLAATQPQLQAPAARVAAAKAAQAVRAERSAGDRPVEEVCHGARAPCSSRRSHTPRSERQTRATLDHGCRSPARLTRAATARQVLCYEVADGGARREAPLADLPRLLAAGDVTTGTYVWTAGLGAWLPLEEAAREMPRLAALLPAAPKISEKTRSATFDTYRSQLVFDW